MSLPVRIASEFHQDVARQIQWYLRHADMQVAGDYADAVDATLEAADESESAPRLATPEMLGQRREALAALRALGGLKDVIPDPAAWQREQREQREDRPLPGRE